MVSSTNSEDASRPPEAGSAAKRPRYSNSLDDLDLDPDDNIKDYKKWVAESLWPAFRSAPLIHLIEYGLPEEQRWIFNFSSNFTKTSIRTLLVLSGTNMYDGGPSVILKRERRGLVWFITTSAIISIIENESGLSIVENHALDLSPKLWAPLALILAIGIYLFRYEIALCIYKYKPKPLEKTNSIRLLRLRAQLCLPNATIQCDMIHTSLQNPPQYVAVSHRWAEPGQAQEMILIDGGLFPVSCSIHTLLLAKRSNLHHRLLWIDSIYINQEDIAEKSRQVGMMRRIFEEADLTICWLGDDTGANKAFALVAQINKIKTESDYAALRFETDAGWVELQKMIHNSYFERVWIIQEIALAKAQIIRYGN